MSDLEYLLDRHFMRIVNMWRNSPRDVESQQQVVRMLSIMYKCPPSMVLRIGRDMNLLHPDMVAEYDRIVAAETGDS